MAKVFDSDTGARVVIVSDDHCPPHVHAAHRAEGWVVRIGFSFALSAPWIMSIAPSPIAVRQRQLGTMLLEVAAAQADCRRLWWDTQNTTCLENKWVVHALSRPIHMLDERLAGARQIRIAAYRALGRATIVTFFDGSQDYIGGGTA